MSAVNVLLLAIQLATRQRDAAGKAVLLGHQSRSNAQDQMEQLESYAADTEAKWALASRAVSSAQMVRHYYQFMDRLQHAMALQRNAMADLDQQLVAARKGLLEAEIRIASLQQLLGKKQAGLLKVQAGREQKQQDEFAALQHRRLRTGPDTLGAP